MAKKVKTVKKEQNTVKLASLIEPVFNQALASVLNQEHPISLSYKLLAVQEAVAAHQKRYESLRMDILAKYCKRDEAGNMVVNESKTQYVLEDKDSFDREWKELLEVEVSVPTVSISSLEKVNISPQLLQSLVNTVVSSVL